jgi:hypothetical protein
MSEWRMPHAQQGLFWVTHRSVWLLAYRAVATLGGWGGYHVVEVFVSTMECSPPIPPFPVACWLTMPERDKEEGLP